MYLSIFSACTLCRYGGVAFRVLQSLAVATGCLCYCRLCLSLTVYFLNLGLFPVNPFDVYDVAKIPVDP